MYKKRNRNYSNSRNHGRFSSKTVVTTEVITEITTKKLIVKSKKNIPSFNHLSSIKKPI